MIENPKNVMFTLRISLMMMMMMMMMIENPKNVQLFTLRISLFINAADQPANEQETRFALAVVELQVSRPTKHCLQYQVEC